MPTHRTQRTQRTNPIAYAWYWLAAWLRFVGQQAARAWRRALWSEVIAIGGMLIGVAGGLLVVIDGGASPATGWIITVAFIVATAALAAWSYSVGREREYVEHLLTQHPTGAPRVVTVECSACGRGHRFIYGPDGWTEAGPIVSSVDRSTT